MSRILHGAELADWTRALATGSYTVSTRGRSLADEGFIHASTTGQLPGVLNGFYADLTSIVLLVLDVPALEALGSSVRWEDVPGADLPFPHVYGPIPSSAVGEGNPVVAAVPLSRADDAPWAVPDLSPYAVLHRTPHT